MRIYLDNCTLQRPLDAQNQTKIILETEAVLAFLLEVQAGVLTLLHSDILDLEVGRIPDFRRKNETLAMLALSTEYIELDSKIIELAHQFEKNGIKAIDSLHLASAVSAKADYFITSDDKFLYKASQIIGLNCKVTNILHLVAEVIK